MDLRKDMKRFGRKPLDSFFTRSLGKLMCKWGYHRWYERVSNYGSGGGSWGYSCFRCGKTVKWDD